MPSGSPSAAGRRARPARTPSARTDFARAALLYLGAAVAEIAGCFAFWGWIRLGKPLWWMLPGISALALFASLLSLVVTATAGRAFSACSGVYVAASLGWLRRVGGVEPDRWDLAGATIYFVSAAVILLGQCAVEAIALRSKSGEAQTN